MLPQFKVRTVFTPHKGSEGKISQYVQYNHGKRGDSTQEAEDQACSEENADKQETHNLENLLNMHSHKGGFMHRVDHFQGRWKRSGLRHRIHHAGSSVGAGDAYRQRAIDDGKEN